MKDFRGPLPLRDDDFARIRRNVLAEVGKKRMSALWLALPIAAAIALAFVLWPAKEPMRVAVVAPPVKRHASVNAQDAALDTRDAALSTQETALRTPHSALSLQHSGLRTHDSRLAHKRRRPQVARAVPMRIDIQTADPNIRIIWIVQ